MSDNTPDTDTTADSTDAKTPLSRSRGMRWTSHFLFIMNAMVLVIMGVLGAWATGYFRGVFDEFDTELSAVTRWILAVPGWGYVVVFVGLAGVLVVKELAIKNRTVTAAIELAMVLFITIVLILYCLGIAVPLLEMWNSLDNGSA